MARFFHLIIDYACGRQNNDPEDVHVLIPQTCKHVKLHGKSTYNLSVIL